MPSFARSLVHSWRTADDRQRVLQVIQPALLGLTDGTLSTLAPIFATAYLAGSHEALIVGLAASIGAAISMGVSEAISDDGQITGRGGAFRRGVITGVGTLIGGAGHSMPFLIADVDSALTVAYVVVAIELVAIAFIRLRYLKVALTASLLQVTAGGAAIVAAGVALGHA